MPSWLKKNQGKRNEQRAETVETRDIGPILFNLSLNLTFNYMKARLGMIHLRRAVGGRAQGSSTQFLNIILGLRYLWNLFRETYTIS